jgi:hypothetical protein
VSLSVRVGSDQFLFVISSFHSWFADLISDFPFCFLLYIICISHISNARVPAPSEKQDLWEAALSGYPAVADANSPGFHWLPAGVHPPVLSEGDAMYDPDRKRECINRCRNASLSEPAGYRTNIGYYDDSDRCSCQQGFHVPVVCPFSSISNILCFLAESVK